MFKKSILASLIVFSLTTQAAEFKTFSEMVSGLNEGLEFVFVVSLNACQSDRPLADFSFSVKPNALMLIPNKKITASDKHFTLNSPSQPGVAAIDYSKFTINADDSVVVQVSVLDAKDYHQIDSHRLVCQLGRGLKVFSSVPRQE